jgi:hypothetical protein
MARRRRRKVDDAHVVRDRTHRIVRAITDHLRSVRPALLERHIACRPRVSDGLDVTERALRVGNRGSRVLSDLKRKNR